MTATLVKPRWLLDTNIISRVIKYPHELLGQRLRDLFDQQPTCLAQQAYLTSQTHPISNQHTQSQTNKPRPTKQIN